jgi:hypothetical protein
MRVVRYLLKYLTKGTREQSKAKRGLFDPEQDQERAVTVDKLRKKKLFFGHHSAMRCSTKFKWLPTEKAGAYLYAKGLEFYEEIYGHIERVKTRKGAWVIPFKMIGTLIHFGHECMAWADIDPWYYECCGHS